MPWTSTDLATLDAAIASGVKRVRFQDREQEYQDVKSMILARTELVNYLAQQSGPPQVRIVRIYTRSGW